MPRTYEPKIPRPASGFWGGPYESEHSAISPEKVIKIEKTIGAPIDRSMLEYVEAVFDRFADEKSSQPVHIVRQQLQDIINGTPRRRGGNFIHPDVKRVLDFQHTCLLRKGEDPTTLACAKRALAKLDKRYPRKKAGRHPVSGSIRSLIVHTAQLIQASGVAPTAYHCAHKNNDGLAGTVVDVLRILIKNHPLLNSAQEKSILRYAQTMADGGDFRVSSTD